ncbi:MAG TPA: signal peptidase I [Candidatus Sulfotelmatobacter sp.]|nr:signal peptidase I [Candidatus Sulfotelmatobacter sp.]
MKALNSTSARRKSGNLVDNIKTFVYAILIALAIRTVAFEPFNIPSGSMIPTLLVGDYLFVSKYSYGYSRYSLPLGLPLIPGRILVTPPKRGDVAVFKYPPDRKTDYIKRIVGLPGDTIEMIKGRLWINGQMVQRSDPVDVEYPTERGDMRHATRYVETLPNGVKHYILEESDDGPLDNIVDDKGSPLVYTVPEGHYFCMGDNRDNSADSRILSGVGYVPLDNFVGRAEFIFFSTDGTAALWEPWKWFGAIRYDRLFQAVR